MKSFVLVTKVLPMLLALCHCLNTVLSYFGVDCIFLNYLCGISILTIVYLYIASYTFRLCEYYRMFLHYCLVIDVVNVIDYYIGIPIADYSILLLYVMITIMMMFVVVYLKLFGR